MRQDGRLLLVAAKRIVQRETHVHKGVRLTQESNRLSLLGRQTFVQFQIVFAAWGQTGIGRRLNLFNERKD
jgi:hypothetical protein